MRHFVILGLMAATVLGLVALGVRQLLSADAPPAPPAASLAPSSDAPAPALEAAPLAPASPAEGTTGRPASPVILGRPAAVTPAAGAWETIPPAPLRSWPTLEHALESARPLLAPCYDEEVQARAAGTPYTTARPLQPSTGAAVLLIELESIPDGRVRVVDAPVESRGAAEDGLLSCVQGALRGLEAKGPVAAGARYRVRYALRPMAPNLGGPQILAPRVRLKPR